MSVVRSWVVFAAAVAVLLLGQDPGGAMEAPQPAGAVILTVAGKIAHSNRGPLDPKRDGFLNHHEVTFKRALQFDRKMLAGLKQGTVRARPAALSAPATFAGPLLHEVLKLAGAEPASVRFLALDGFGAELDGNILSDKRWILAMEMDERPLALGGRGPIWLMRPSASGVEVGEEEGQRWVWALFYMEVK
ncbi:MAG: hypothetical protein ACR2PO_18270 [Methyloligellaceae bacterium]